MRTILICFLVLAAARLPVLRGKEEQPTPGAEAPAESRSPFAALDDVRLLANGLLQLGQSLREFVHKTKGQINDIFQKLNIFDRSFYRLSVLAGEIKEEEEELKKTAVVLKANNEEIKGFSVRISSKVDAIMLEKRSLQSKVEGLEEKLRGLSQGPLTADQAGEIDGLRGVINNQEKSITALLEAVREQSEQLNYQRMKIKSLEQKFTAGSFGQDTIERTPESFSSDPPTLSPYLPPADGTKTAAAGLPSDCGDAFDRGEKVSGVFAIRPPGSEPFMAFCDMTADHGATVIQRRKDGSVDFHQSWEKYENGFGDFHGEFWLGLSKIRSLAAGGNSVLRILLEDWKHNKRFVEYDFQLDGPESDYSLRLKLLSGDATDLLRNHTGTKFSAKGGYDDRSRDPGCAHGYAGGWWFNSCGDSNLNGRYFPTRHKRRWDRRRGIHFKMAPEASYLLRFTQMSVHAFNASSLP
ncbi:angiopoietin-related protein 3-like [Syngnathoides biaculeatus]|uniref:angiopoietin-related protein 3-like n=1 Tax=Syngnathoides biaculeatus TaxID=300417 RepID=UPI002ADDB249|nr:angiopoietin-related protein 3-like [Syngnathoides biaculeatus]